MLFAACLYIQSEALQRITFHLMGVSAHVVVLVGLDRAQVRVRAPSGSMACP